MDKNQIKQLLDSSAGRALKEFLLSKLNELQDIRNLQEFSTVAAQALELKSQKRAHKKLEQILEMIMTLSIDEQKKDPRDSFEVL